jgi:hypothetical protein
MSKIQLVLSFDSIEELKSYVEDYEAIELTKIKKLFKKSNDKRGCSTKLLHQKAKEYQTENPGLTYKESLKQIGEKIRENKNNTKPIENNN